MLSASQYSLTAINGEQSILVTPRSWAPDTDITGVIYCHGHGGDATEMWHVDDSSQTQRAVVNAIVNKGIPVLSCYLGGNKWGNSEVVTKLGAAVAYMQNTVGTRPGRVAFYAQSMGHLSAMNWARLNKDQVACVVASMGVTDLNDIHSQGSYSDIDDAYPAGAALYNSEAYNPMINAASKFAGIPWQGWIGGSDTVAVTSKMQQFGALIGGEVHVVSGTHSWGTVGNYDIPSIVNFITRHTGIE